MGFLGIVLYKAQSEWESDVVALNNMEKAAEMYYLLERRKAFLLVWWCNK